jgi:hypothetical protein
MSLKDYLEKNSGNPQGNKYHINLIKDLSKNPELFSIHQPLNYFFETIFQPPKRDGKIFSPSRLDLVVLNSGLYVFEGKICMNEITRQIARKKTHEINKQLTKARGFFRRKFNVEPTLIGVYAKAKSDSINCYIYRGEKKFDELKISEVPYK